MSMKIKGTIVSKQKRVYIRLPVMFNGKSSLIRFLVDTGASVTTLGFIDVENLTGEDAVNLPPYSRSIIGIGGNVDARALQGTFLILRPDGEILTQYSEVITTLPKSKHKGKKLDLQDPQVRQRLAVAFPSLLGMDVISKGTLYINFKKNDAYLEIS